jgi:hypothetical protein
MYVVIKGSVGEYKTLFLITNNPTVTRSFEICHNYKLIKLYLRITNVIGSPCLLVNNPNFSFLFLSKNTNVKIQRITFPLLHYMGVKLGLFR